MLRMNAVPFIIRGTSHLLSHCDEKPLSVPIGILPLVLECTTVERINQNESCLAWRSKKLVKSIL